MSDCSGGSAAVHSFHLFCVRQEARIKDYLLRFDEARQVHRLSPYQTPVPKRPQAE